MRFRILGPVEIEANGRTISPQRRRERCLLGVLLLEANRPVSVDRLAGLLWDDDPPKRIRGAVQGHISRLRAALVAAGAGSDVELVFSGEGYRLVVDRETVDAHQFRALKERAAGFTEPAQRVEQLRAALDLWRGPALADAVDGWAQARLCSDLEEQRIAALEDMASACLQLRREREILPELARFAGENPGREGLVGLYMRALYQAGRRADALDVYSRARTYFADELGLDPGPALRGLHQAVLRDELALASVKPGSASERLQQTRLTSTRIPRQLPADVAGFTGRDAQLERLDSVLPKQDKQTTSVVISSVGGTAGVGKTALAIHWAHRVLDRFPDGQLYVNLRGYDLEQPMSSSAALARFLAALGVSEADIPQDLQDRAARYRSEIAGRRMLIVLDNASSVEQVRPLLPGSNSSVVVVTSRDSLAGLVALHGAYRLDLDPLTPDEAATLLRRQIGPRVDAEPGAAAALASQCAHLPLALRVAGELAVSLPTTRLADLVVELADRQRRLDLLDGGGDPYAAVRTVFSWSIHHLPSNAAGVFRILGVHPGPDIDPYAVAALANTSLDHARRSLNLLARAHLLHLISTDRWGMHDLLRAYAAELSTVHDSDEARRAAQGRLLDYYRHTASMAMDTAYPYDAARRPWVPPAGSPAPDLSDPMSATGWLDIELPNLLAVAQYTAGNTEWPEYTWHVSALLRWHLLTRSRYRDAYTLHHHALTTARSKGDRAGESSSLICLGDVCRVLGQADQATHHYQQAVQIARLAGDRASELAAFIGLGEVEWRQGGYEPAAGYYQRAVQIARASGDRGGELAALNGLGQIHRMRSRQEQAASCYQRAIQIARVTGNHPGELYALNGLGAVRRTQGRHTEATAFYQRSIQVARATGDRGGEVAALNGLGWVRRAQGLFEEAADDCELALEMARAIGHRSGEMDALTGAGWVRLRQGRYKQASDHYQQLIDLARRAGGRYWVFEALQGLGRIQQATGGPDAAIGLHEEALALAGDLSKPDDAARAHDGLAHAYHALDQHEQARTHWQAALEALTRLGIDYVDDERATVAAIRSHLGQTSE